MQDYGVRDVERLLRLPPAIIRALVRAGFVSPARGARNSLRFSFQDLVVLRTAQALAKARVPQRRIVRAMVEMRRVAESGQHALDFGSEPAPAAFRMAPPDASAHAHGWFEKAVALEDEDIASAVRAYGQALSADPQHLDARINLGWLLHEVGMLKEAEKIYRTAPPPSSGDALLLYNLGVLLEDLRRPREALQAYEAALRADPGLADANFNLALLYEQQGKAREAIRHMSQYRRLTGR
jgi:tetratricopeptide (TPR) repeat protein